MDQKYASLKSAKANESAKDCIVIDLTVMKYVSAVEYLFVG